MAKCFLSSKQVFNMLHVSNMDIYVIIQAKGFQPFKHFPQLKL